MGAWLTASFARDRGQWSSFLRAPATWAAARCISVAAWSRWMDRSTSLTVVDHLLALPNARELDLLLLQVVPPEPDHGPARKAEQALTALVERVRETGLTAEARVVEARDPAGVIVGTIRQDLVDFIAMTTRGAGGLARTMLGSVATAVVRASEVPVFLVTPHVPIPLSFATAD
jgi:nucleotide-binding universal stress UspA family protein